MTYNVFSGTLNPIQSIIQALIELSSIRTYVLRIFWCTNMQQCAWVCACVHCHN